MCCRDCKYFEMNNDLAYWCKYHNFQLESDLIYDTNCHDWTSDKKDK